MFGFVSSRACMLIHDSTNVVRANAHSPNGAGLASWRGWSWNFICSDRAMPPDVMRPWV